MANETLEFVLTVDGKQAQSALAETRRSAETMAGGVDKASTSMGRFSAWIDKQRKDAKPYQESISKNAAAITLLSQSMGAANSTGAKLVQTGGALLGAFAAGGPYGLAFAAGLSGIEAMTSAGDKFLKKQDEMMDRATKGLATSVANLHRLKAELLMIDRGAFASSLGIRDQMTAAQQRLNDLRAREEKIKASSAPVGITDDRYLKENIKTAQAELDALSKLHAAQVSKDMESAGLMYDPQGRLVLKADYEKGVQEAQKVAQAARERAAAAAADKFLARTDVEADLFAPPALLEYSFDGSADQVYMLDALDFRRLTAQEEIEIEKRKRDEMNTIGDAMADDDIKRMEERRELARQEAADYAGLASSMASALGTLTAQGIAGQEKAFESFVASASSAIGGFIQLKGGQLLAMGTETLLASAGANPLGYAQIAGGLGLVSAGAAVATGGPAAVSAIMGQAGASSGGASRDVGARSSPSRSSSDSGSSGPAVINITYGGVSGPDADSGARAMQEALLRARRRGFA